ncbi:MULTISPECIES: hypothetical protein [Bacteria]|uniref:hypothetical protein n=1 Tax=Bacteria TaxID=2 RepID=UPI003C7DC16C
MRDSKLSRVLSWVGTLIVGAVYGLAATIGHAAMIGPLPVGLVAGAISCAALLIAIRTLTGDRWAVVAAGLGMIAAVLVISGRGPGGSVVVQNGLLGQVWTYLAAGIVLLVIAWPDLSRLRASALTDGATPQPGASPTPMAGRRLEP